jgi:hypothetical protein
MRFRTGRSQKLDVRGQRSELRTRQIVVILAASAALGVFAGCEWLLGLDTTPPSCQIASPVDSSSVNGNVIMAATAFDSIGVERVEFYADGSLVGTDSSSPYSGSWDASALAEGSWHGLSCVAYDAAQNKGYSDTVSVEIGAVGQKSVYHGELDVQPHAREQVHFVVQAGDTLAGDVQVVTGGTLSSFMWLDQDNYQKFAANQSYTEIYRADNITQASVAPMVISAGTYYLVFVNNANAAVKCWARFVLE